uniref:Sushi domain-containing protein n=1 Tax=Ciona savignyi TaxID=51511 RepID=H2ZE23_CIOSA
MMKTIILITVVFATTEALKCWSCDNAATNEECLQNGRLKQCRENQESCQTEVRTIDRGILISKRCKQGTACGNNYIQNPRPAWKPSQCSGRTPSSVCRCCCDFDECNKPEIDCLSRRSPIASDEVPIQRCRPVASPRFGLKNCSFMGTPDSLGSVCTFTCNPGFKRVGARATTCVGDGLGEPAYNYPIPECKPMVCLPTIQQPANGGYSCTSSNMVGSRCSFSCNEGYMLSGKRQLICGRDQKWNGLTPTCVRISCNPAHNDP